MAKIIYLIKMVLCWPKIQNMNILNDEQYNKLKQCVNFAVYIYIEQWFSAPLVTQAPLNDLSFYKKTDPVFCCQQRN